MAFSDFLRDEPKVPKFTPVDTTKQQAKAIAGNVSALPDLEKLGAGINAFNQDQMSKLLESAAPGYASILKGQKDIISSEMKGEIPKDVADQILRTTAQKSLSGGFSGGMAKNLTARDLGLTSLDLVNKGVDSGTRWLATARSTVAPTFDVTSMFVTPAQRIAVAQSNNENMWNRNWLKSQVDASFGTGTILANTLGGMESSLAGVGGQAAGAAAGGGGGGGGL